MVVELFDSHSYVKELCAAGFTEKQAEIQIKIHMSFAKDQLPSKADISDIKADIEQLRVETKVGISESKIDIIKWVIGSNLFFFSLIVGVIGAMFKFLK